MTNLVSDIVKTKIPRVQLQSLCTYVMVSQKIWLCLVGQSDFCLHSLHWFIATSTSIPVHGFKDRITGLYRGAGKIETLEVGEE